MKKNFKSAVSNFTDFKFIRIKRDGRARYKGYFKRNRAGV